MQTLNIYCGVRLYANRIVLDPLTAQPEDVVQNFNFIYNDGITTSVVINREYINKSPSYVVVVDNDNNIDKTGWYVMNCTRTRQGQVQLDLYRDFLGELMSSNDLNSFAPTNSFNNQDFICTKSSTIPDSISYAQYKKTMNLSQVKQNEYLLKDREKGEGWIVGYIAKPSLNNSTWSNPFVKTYQTKPKSTSNIIPSYVADTLDAWTFSNLNYYTLSHNCWATIRLQNTDEYRHVSNIENNQLENVSSDFNQYCVVAQENYLENVRNGLIQAQIAVATSQYCNITAQYTDLKDTDILNANGKYLQITSGSNSGFYLISVNSTRVNYLNYPTSNVTFPSDGTDAFRNSLGSSFISSPNNYYLTARNLYFNVYTFTLTKVNDDSYYYSCKVVEHINTEDVPYDVFCIPLGGQFNSLGTLSNINNNACLDIVSQMITQNSGANILYDVQWVPYVPEIDCTQNYNSDNDDSNAKVNYIVYSYTDSSGITFSLNVGALYWLSTNKSTLSLESPYKVQFSTNYLNNRILNEEQYLRLTSPTYSSSFDFNAIQNNGLDMFNIDITLKPYSPYFYVRPKYQGLYGNDFSDGRGLILSGDFSLDQLNNAWETYKLQNKNYENIFNRGIQSLDLTQNYQSHLITQSNIENFMNIPGATLQGAVNGGLLGGTGGAVLGGIMNFGVSNLDAGVNYVNSRRQREIMQNTRNQSITMYQYQLGNIQALPSTLTRITSFNIDYKVYPILEEYECTSQEKDNLENSIKYNGIDVNLMCKLNDFTKGFIQGYMPYIPYDYYLNSNQIQVIEEEMQKGFYLEAI